MGKGIWASPRIASWDLTVEDPRQTGKRFKQEFNHCGFLVAKIPDPHVCWVELGKAIAAEAIQVRIAECVTQADIIVLAYMTLPVCCVPFRSMGSRMG